MPACQHPFRTIFNLQSSILPAIHTHPYLYIYGVSNLSTHHSHDHITVHCTDSRGLRRTRSHPFPSHPLPKPNPHTHPITHASKARGAFHHPSETPPTHPNPPERSTKPRKRSCRKYSTAQDGTVQLLDPIPTKVQYSTMLISPIHYCLLLYCM